MEEENSLVQMLNSNDRNDVNLALAIVNKLPSNRDILNKAISDSCSHNRWYKATWLNGANYFRHDGKGDGPLCFVRHPEE